MTDSKLLSTTLTAALLALGTGAFVATAMSSSEAATAVRDHRDGAPKGCRRCPSSATAPGGVVVR
jgi:hypothetical protein